MAEIFAMGGAIALVKIVDLAHVTLDRPSGCLPASVVLVCPAEHA